MNGKEIRRITIPQGARVGGSKGMVSFSEDDLLDAKILSAGGAEPAADLLVTMQLQTENA